MVTNVYIISFKVFTYVNIIYKKTNISLNRYMYSDVDDDDVYLYKLQTKGVKKSILYMYNVDQPIRHK
jgi:hypothetical protein